MKETSLISQRKEEWNRKRYENAESALEKAIEQAGTQHFTQATHAQAGASNPENAGESATAENTTQGNMSDTAAEANSGDFDWLFNVGNNGASSPENTGESIDLSGSENTQQEENISFSTSGFGEGAQAGNQDGVTGAEAQNEEELDFDFLSDFEEVATGSGNNDTGAESSEEQAGYDNISIDVSPITGPESAEDFRKRLQAELNGQGLEQNFAQGMVENSEQSQNGGATVVDANKVFDELNFEP